MLSGDSVLRSLKPEDRPPASSMAASSQDDAQEALTNASASGADCYEVDGGEQLMELSSSGSKQHLPKARKPYTISKQREKWTEEEHQKFLEALKLYGRGWRKIQEHVGTKTAVQIRSHAQKFFSKVVRETTVGAEASIKSIEIPPPRPKRKPLHPYPRKCVHVCSDQFERSLSPSSLGVERESQSPTSVLAPVCSDTFGSPQSEQQNGCSSLTSCDSQQSLDVLPNAKDSEPIMSDKGNASSTPIDQFSGRIPEDFPAKESEASLETAAVPENERAVQVARTRSFKLFGRTVLVTGSEKVSSSPDTDRYVSAVSQQHCVDVQMSLGLVNHQTSCAEAEIENMSFAEADCSPSCAGSDAGSTNGVENREKSMDAADSQPQGQSSCSEVRFPSLSCYSSKGFMPYKRCLADRDMVASEREQQRARVCS